MDLLRKKMLFLFLVPIAVSLILVILYETELLLPGSGTGDRVMEYYAVGIMELITICCIPLALRLFKFRFVDRQIVAGPRAGLVKWGAVRSGMIGVPMVVNTFLYYQFMHVAFGYMAIIGLLCLAFVYPSEARCRQEMKEQD